MTYEIIIDESGQKVLMGTEPSGQVWCIPQDPNNSMYKAYLESLNK